MNALRVVVLAVALMGAMGQGKAPDPLIQARQLYNEQRYDAAIAQAEAAQRVPDLAPAGLVVMARARIERYRALSDPRDLTQAQDALRRVPVERLDPRDQVEYTIGLGQLLFLDDQYTFDDRYSAAAEQFEVALARADLLDADSRDRLFDWWALSLDRQAQFGPEHTRHAGYERIVARAEAEIGRHPTSLAASYWLAAGAAGVDDAARAWGAAVAAWARAASFGDRGASLRDDLDRLVTQVILPERAMQLAAGADAREALTSLLAQWQQVKERWK
ncbi:MAG: hypothetical protein IT184_06525 [Acidobacteria bacterium]|nr:hypothetical protein [Acidobacteriota bacterium]